MTAKEKLIKLIIDHDGKTQEEAEARAEEITKELIEEEKPGLEEAVKRRARVRSGMKK